MESEAWTKGYVECQVPRKCQNSRDIKKDIKNHNTFPSIGREQAHLLNYQFISDHKKTKQNRSPSSKPKNKFILMRSSLHGVIQRVQFFSEAESLKESKVELVSKIASKLWRINKGAFQTYHELLAQFDEYKSFNKPTNKLSLKKLTEAIGRECIPSTYSYETLTNGAHTTAIESKKTYKAFCGRFSLNEATGRVRKKKPIQTFALRSANIEDVFLI